MNTLMKYKNEAIRYAILLLLLFTCGIYCGVVGDAFRLQLYKAQIRSLQKENTEISEKNAGLNDRLFQCQVREDE